MHRSTLDREMAIDSKVSFTNNSPNLRDPKECANEFLNN